MGVARRAPSIWPLMVIVALDSFALIAVSTLVQDVTIGFFNHGDQCIGQSSQVQSPGCRQGLSTTEKVSGWQAGISAVFAFILSPLMGAVSDAYGRVPLMMVILVFGTLLPTVVLVVSSYTGFTLWMYIAWRSVTYGFSSLAIAFAYVADTTYLTFSESTVFAVAAGCSLISCVITQFFLGESLSLELQYQKREQILAKRQGGVLVAVAHAPLYANAPVSEQPGRSSSPAAGASTVATLNEPLLVDRTIVSSLSPSPIMRDSSEENEEDEEAGGTAIRRTTSSELRAPPSFRFLFVASSPLSDVMILNRNWLLRALAFIIFLLCIVVFGQIAVSYLYLHVRFGMDQQQHAILSAVQGVCGIFTQSIGLRFASRYLSNKSIMCVGLVCLVASNVIYGVMWSQDLVFLSAPVASVAFMCFPAITSLKSNAMAPDEQGAIQGALGAVRSVGGGIGPLLLNQLLSMTQGTEWVGLTFYVGAAISLLAFLISFTVTEFVWTSPNGAAPAPPLDDDKRNGHTPPEEAPESDVDYPIEATVVNEHQLNHL